MRHQSNHLSAKSMALTQNPQGLWLDTPAAGAGGIKLNANFTELGIRTPKCNYAASVPPSHEDNVSSGYGPGSKWVANGIPYLCVADGVWQQVASPIDSPDLSPTEYPGDRQSTALMLDAKDITPQSDNTDYTGSWGGKFSHGASAAPKYRIGVVAAGQPSLQFGSDRTLFADAADATLATWAQGKRSLSVVCLDAVGSNQMILCKGFSGNPQIFYAKWSGNFQHIGEPSQSAILSPYGYAAGTLRLVTFTYDPTTLVAEVWCNGFLMQRATGVSYDAYSAADAWNLGSAGGFAWDFEGHIVSLHFETGILTQEQHLSTLAYWRRRMYDPSKVTILCHGDSRTSGLLLSDAATESFPALLQANTGHKVWNDGNPGAVTSYLLSTFGSWCSSLSSLNPTIVVIFAGINDWIVATNLTAYQSVDNIVAMDDISGSLGMPTVVLAEIDSNSPGQEQLAFNSILVARLPSVAGRRVLSRTDLNPTVGYLGSSSNTTNFYDGVHPKAPGYVAMESQNVRPAVASLLAAPSAVLALDKATGRLALKTGANGTIVLASVTSIVVQDGQIVSWT